MLAPLCKTCQERHYGPCTGGTTQLQRLASAPVAATKASKPKAMKAASKRAVKPTPAKKQATAPRKRAPKGTFDKAAYQRDYMRKKRAATKAPA